MRLSEGDPFKTCANPQAHNPKLNYSQPKNHVIQLNLFLELTSNNMSSQFQL